MFNREVLQLLHSTNFPACCPTTPKVGKAWSIQSSSLLLITQASHHWSMYVSYNVTNYTDSDTISSILYSSQNHVFKQIKVKNLYAGEKRTDKEGKGVLQRKIKTEIS